MENSIGYIGIFIGSFFNLAIIIVFIREIINFIIFIKNLGKKIYARKIIIPLHLLYPILSLFIVIYQISQSIKYGLIGIPVYLFFLFLIPGSINVSIKFFNNGFYEHGAIIGTRNILWKDLSKHNKLENSKYRL